MHKVIIHKDENGQTVIDGVSPRLRDAAYEASTAMRARMLADELADDIAYHFKKHGHQRLNGLGWIAVCAEEQGEAVQAYLQKRHADAIKEAMQTAACYIRFAIEIEREINGMAEEEWPLYTDPV